MIDKTEKLFKKLDTKFKNIIETDEFAQLFVETIKMGENQFYQTSKIAVKRFDRKFIDTLEGFFPHLDQVVRDPKRFIKTYHDVVDIEKAKKTDQNSVRHLAANSHLVRSFDQGVIQPKKIQTVMSEDEFGIYENRFIKTLIEKLFTFIEKRYQLIKEQMNVASERHFRVDSNIQTGPSKVKFGLEIDMSDTVSEDDVETENMILFERLEMLRQMVIAFRGSKFMDNVKHAKTIVPPIMQTNIMMMEPNYRKCFELWQYIDSYESLGFTLDIEEKIENFSDEYIQEIYNTILLAYATIKNNQRRVFKLDNYQSIKERKRVSKPKVTKKFKYARDEFGEIIEVEEIAKLTDKQRDVLEKKIDKEKERIATQKAKEAEKARLAKEKEKEQAKKLKEKEKEKARLAKEKEKEKAKLAAQKAKEAEKAKLAKEKEAEKARLAKEKEAEKAKLAKEKEAVVAKEQKATTTPKKLTTTKSSSTKPKSTTPKKAMTPEEKAKAAEKAKLAKEKEREKMKLQKQKEREKEKARLEKEKEKEKARIAKEKELIREKEKLARQLEKEAEKIRLQKERVAERLAQKQAALAIKQVDEENVKPKQEENIVEQDEIIVPIENLVVEQEVVDSKEESTHSVVSMDTMIAPQLADSVSTVQETIDEVEPISTDVIEHVAIQDLTINSVKEIEKEEELEPSEADEIDEEIPSEPVHSISGLFGGISKPEPTQQPTQKTIDPVVLVPTTDEIVQMDQMIEEKSIHEYDTNPNDNVTFFALDLGLEDEKPKQPVKSKVKADKPREDKSHYFEKESVVDHPIQPKAVVERRFQESKPTFIQPTSQPAKSPEQNIYDILDDEEVEYITDIEVSLETLEPSEKKLSKQEQKILKLRQKLEKMLEKNSQK